MSADNWTICPKCGKQPETQQEKSQRLYGKVTAEQFVRAMAKPIPEVERTMREDYSIGVYEDGKGLFQIDYRCSCSECGFEWRYEVEVDLKKLIKPKAKHGKD